MQSRGTAVATAAPVDEAQPATDGRSRAEDLWPAGLFVVGFAFLFSLSWLWAQGYHDSYDLGYFRQAAYLIGHGRSTFVSIRGLDLLADHAYFVFYPVALLTRVLPSEFTLLGLQALALAFGIVPLWRIGREHAHLPVNLSAVLAIAYLAFPATQNINLFDFHPEVLAGPALLLVVLYYLRGRVGLAALALGFALLCREDVGLVAIGLGALAFVRGDRRLGLGTAGVGLAWFGVTTQLIMPHFAGGQVTQAMRFSQYGGSTGAVIGFALTHPLRILKDLFSHQNLVYFVWLLVPVALLPLASPSWLIPAVPLQLAYLLSNQPAAHDVQHQYTACVIPFVFVATAFGLSRLVEWRLPAVAGLNRIGRLGARLKPLAASLGIVALVAGMGAGLHVTNHDVLTGPWNWARRGAREQAMRQAADLVPPSASVAASVRMWNVIAPRRELYNFPMPWVFYGHPPGDPVPVDVRQRGVQWIVVDTGDIGQWPPTYETALQSLTTSQGFAQVFNRDSIVVFERRAAV